jgi:hypothetical protein
MTNRPSCEPCPRPRLLWWILLSFGWIVLGGCDGAVDGVVLSVEHRMYTQFHEVHRVRMGERFRIGDTDYEARVAGYIPDFVIDDKTKKVVSRSKEPRNPALMIEIFENGKKTDVAWAFPGNGPPHYSRHAMLSFHIDELIWKEGKAPADSSSGKPGIDSLDVPRPDAQRR